VDRVGSDPADLVPDADYVILTVPAFARTEVLQRIAPHLSPRTWVGSFPGVGGFDWVARSVLGREQPIFGMQHIPWLTLLLTYGQKALVTGVRGEVWVGTLPRSRAGEVATELGRLLRLPVRPLDNILVNALTPGNPIFHTVRIYSLFQDWMPGKTFPEPIPFYRAWDERASEYYLACDREIQAACRAIPLDLDQVWPILQHYGLSRGEDLTERIRGLSPLHPVQAPLAETPRGLVPNLESRFFTEDFPHGLLVVRAVCHLAGVATPTMDAMLTWAGKLLGRRYLAHGETRGKGVAGLPIPQNHGLSTLADLVRHATSDG
jgi:hypothetical protein